jgi:hypothetical protein
MPSSPLRTIFFIIYPKLSSDTTIRTMLQCLGISEDVATYLTGTCGIDSLDDIAYLDGVNDKDTAIMGVMNPGVMVTTGAGSTAVTSHNNGIPVSIRAVANMKLCSTSQNAICRCLYIQ